MTDSAAKSTTLEAPTGFEYTDLDLLDRAVRNIHYGKGMLPRWSHVGQTFSMGSGYSIGLCKRWGLDPHEMLGSAERVEVDDE